MHTNLRKFFDCFVKWFDGVERFMEDESTHPENEIKQIKELYSTNQITEDEMITSLSRLSAMRYRFTINGRVWNPIDESFHTFTSGTYHCMGAECPQPIYEYSVIEKFIRERYLSCGNQTSTVH